MALQALTIDQLRDAVRLTSSAADTRLTLLGESIEDFLAEYLGVKLVPTVITGERVPGGGRWLRTLYGPVTAVTSVSVAVPSDLSDPSVPNTEYEIHPEGLLSKHEQTLWVYYEYSVTYTTGYANAAAVPPRFKQVALELVSASYFNPGGKQGQSNKAGSVSWSLMLSERQQQMLESISHRRMF